MARYHEGLKYHEDNIEKHSITDDEINFLIELQKEMNTQDYVGQADPRYWVIKGTEKIYNVEDADGFELYDRDCCATVASDIEGIYEYINCDLLGDIIADSGVKYSLSLEDGIFNKEIKVSWIIEGEDECEILSDEHEVKDWLEKFGYDEYEVVTYKIVGKIYENTMFLTQKDAENHLRSNYYHYSEDAHTYAMTSWRSREVENLWKILGRVDWKLLIQTGGLNE